MKIATWNIRGWPCPLNKMDFKKHKIYDVGILETELCLPKLQGVMCNIFNGYCNWLTSPLIELEGYWFCLILRRWNWWSWRLRHKLCIALLYERQHPLLFILALFMHFTLWWMMLGCKPDCISSLIFYRWDASSITLLVLFQCYKMRIRINHLGFLTCGRTMRILVILYKVVRVEILGTKKYILCKSWKVLKWHFRNLVTSTLRTFLQELRPQIRTWNQQVGIT